MLLSCGAVTELRCCVSLSEDAECEEVADLVIVARGRGQEVVFSQQLQLKVLLHVGKRRLRVLSECIAGKATAPCCCCSLWAKVGGYSCCLF